MSLVYMTSTDKFEGVFKQAPPNVPCPQQYGSSDHKLRLLLDAQKPTYSSEQIMLLMLCYVMSGHQRELCVSFLMCICYILIDFLCCCCSQKKFVFYV